MLASFITQYEHKVIRVVGILFVYAFSEKGTYTLNFVLLVDGICFDIDVLARKWDVVRLFIETYVWL